MSILLVSTAPFAALFLTLMAIVAALHTATGFGISIASAEPCDPGEGNIVVVQVLSHRGLRINVEDLKRDNLESRL